MERGIEFHRCFRREGHIVRDGDEGGGPQPSADPASSDRWTRRNSRTKPFDQRNAKLVEEGCAVLSVSAFRAAPETKPIQEAVRLHHRLTDSEDLDENPVKARKWTSRIGGFVKRTGQSVHQANKNINAESFLHRLILCTLLLECSQLMNPTDHAAVLARGTSKGPSLGCRPSSSLSSPLSGGCLLSFLRVTVCHQPWVVVFLHQVSFQ